MFYINFTITVIAALILRATFRKFVIDRTLKYENSVLISSLCFRLCTIIFTRFYAFGLGFIFGIVYFETTPILRSPGINIIGGVISMVILKLLNLKFMKPPDNNLPEGVICQN